MAYRKRTDCLPFAFRHSLGNELLNLAGRIKNAESAIASTRDLASSLNDFMKQLCGVESPCYRPREICKQGELPPKLIKLSLQIDRFRLLIRVHNDPPLRAQWPVPGAAPMLRDGNHPRAAYVY